MHTNVVCIIKTKKQANNYKKMFIAIQRFPLWVPVVRSFPKLFAYKINTNNKFAFKCARIPYQAAFYKNKNKSFFAIKQVEEFPLRHIPNSVNPVALLLSGRSSYQIASFFTRLVWPDLKRRFNVNWTKNVCSITKQNTHKKLSHKNPNNNSSANRIW